MFSYLYSTIVIYVFVTICPWCVLTKDNHNSTHSRNSDRRSKILLTNDGPTTIGGKTTFSAEVLNCNGKKYRFCWRNDKGEQCDKSEGPKAILVVGNWSSIGKKAYNLEVERISPRYRLCGKNTTTVLVTDTINAQLKVSSQDQEPYFVGPVKMSVQIHDPSHLFDPQNTIYTWDFNDGSISRQTFLNKMTHNFTEDRVYSVSVFILSYALGTLYNGTASKTMHFFVNFSPELQVYNLNNRIPSPVLKLASQMHDRIFMAMGELEFIVTYNNPYSIIKNITTGWNFHDGPTIQNFPGSNITHNYTTIGERSVWATPKFTTRHRTTSLTIQQYIIVEETVSELNLTTNSSCTTKGDLLVNVTCRGSKPFQMCWKLFKTSHHPLFNNCTSLSQTCYFQINYTIPYPGSFTLDIYVLNHVGSANRIQKFSIPEPTPKPHSNTDAKTAGAVVPIIICVILVVVVLVFVAKKVYSSRHYSVLETADFDFRDEDCRSVDSYLVNNHCCSSFRICRKFSKKKETFPLLDNWGETGRTATMYSDIL